MKDKWIALGVLLILLTAAVSIPLAGWWKNQQGIILHAHMAEAGGWMPGALTAVAGQPLTLRLISDDVMHGFAVGQSDQPPVDVKPGEISEVTLTFDRPGKYTYYCTRWCGVNHWRMRGVIEVKDPTGASMGPQQNEKLPLYVRLGLDLDAERPLASPLPQKKPSAQPGIGSDVSLPGEITSREYYLANSPAEVFRRLKAEPGLSELPDQDIWNLVAVIWDNQISSQSLENGREMYAENCAACHGEQGDGDGVFAAELAPPASDEHTDMAQGEMTLQHADFTDPVRMLSASPALLQGKIVRGGMGTGMPYWGPIFTEEQTWDLVAFLWSFQFDLEVNK